MGSTQIATVKSPVLKSLKMELSTS